MHVGRISRFCFLIVGVSSGQLTGEKSLPVAWVSIKSRGTWVDEAEPSKGRIVRPGDPIFSFSKLVRRDPKSTNDVAWVSLPDGSYQQFACSQALVCDKALDISKLVELAKPHFHDFGTVVNTMSGRRRPLRSILHDDVTELAGGVPTGAVFDPTAAAGTYALAWCRDGLLQKCPDEPEPVMIDWNPKEPTRLMPAPAVRAGLHRLILLRQAAGEWFYTEEDSWLLVVNDPGTRIRVAQALKSLGEETKDLPDQAIARIRAVALLAQEVQTIK